MAKQAIKIKVKKFKPEVVYENKKAHHDYEILHKWTAGIVLEGWEVKALDEYNGDITVGYCRFVKNDFCLSYSKISPLAHHNRDDADSLKDRKLLLNKTELKRIAQALKEKGLTCLPLKLYRNKVHLWKIDIAVVKPYKNYDKREKLKEKDLKREHHGIR